MKRRLPTHNDIYNFNFPSDFPGTSLQIPFASSVRTDAKMEALKHYFGITQSNELIARGIEIRRHDAPNFIKEFQTELLYTLFDCKDSAEVMSKGYENALLLIARTIDKIMTGEIQLKNLVVSKKTETGLDQV